MSNNDFTPGAIERLTSHPLSAVATTALASGFAATNPVAIFLPILSSSLAGGRQQARIQAFISAVTAELEAHADLLQKISDSQYQLISDSLVSALHTLDERKLDYLRLAIRNTLFVEIEPQQSASIARAVRDISADEAAFLLRSFSYKHITIVGALDVVETPDTLSVAVDSRDASAVDGLLSLGLLRADSGWGGSGLVITQNAKMIRDLLMEPES